MSEIDNKVDSDEDAVLDIEPSQKPRRKYGKIALGFTAISALIIGGASGGGFVQYIMPHITPSQSASVEALTVNLAPLEAQISQLANKNTQLADKNNKLETRLLKLDTAFKALQTSVEDTAQSFETSQGEAVDLSPLEARLDAIENAPKAAVINENVLERLETLQDEGSAALDLSAIETRLADLETSLETALEDAFDPMEIPDATRETLLGISENQAEVETKFETQIAALTEDINALKSQLTDAQADLNEMWSTQTAEVQPAPPSILPFPKQALMDAITAQSPKKPLLQRALGKHIKVKDPSDPAVIMTMIEKDLADGNIETAKARFDTLPPEIRIAANGWRDSLNAAQ